MSINLLLALYLVFPRYLFNMGPGSAAVVLDSDPLGTQKPGSIQPPDETYGFNGHE